MLATNDLFERLEVLKDAYRGQTAFIISCGPSLSQYDPDLLRAFLSDKLVLSIKQAYQITAGQTDFHILHHSNIQRYRYPSPAPVVVNEDEGQSFIQPDLLLPKDALDLYQAVSLSRQFDRYRLDKNPVRPCGPGILYEVAIYLALHLGAANAVILGWDLFSDPEQLRQLFDGAIEHKHFYDADRGFAALTQPDRSASGLAERLEKFRDGDLVNTRLHIPADDIVLTALGSRPLCEWLDGQGMRLFTTTDSPNVSRAIPRVELLDTASADYLERQWMRQRMDLPSNEFPHFQPLKVPSIAITAADPRMTCGWHGLEFWNGLPVRWSGPSATSTIPLPLDRSRDLRLTVEVPASTVRTRPELFESGNPIPLKWAATASGGEVAEGVLPSGEGWSEVFSLLEFRCGEVVRASDLVPGSSDTRSFGFPFASLRVEPTASS